jgi:eukaryotic-like serine/threonine-protein kinase
VKDLGTIEEIYHAALELPENKRQAFLNQKCGDDDELRREVDSLLGFDDQAKAFIETPPDDLAAALFANRAGHDILGKRLDHYHVISQLGSGGMGEVFLAEDTKLGRKVALKLLPAQFASDRERKLRFEHEARSISALNHRNIITIYDIEEIDGLSFMATEFVDGQTLRERIASGPLGWQEAANIGAQIASALDAAHSVGIIHRDIKPANIMIRRDGDVKVLDFGLAKLTAPKGESGGFDTRDHTAQNRVMGTINYMSPEQALGDDLDERTDIFSLGVVLYEMLTGTQPFSGPSEAAVYNATINRNPPPIRVCNPDIPSEFESVVDTAIAKDRNGRFRSAADLRNDLQSLTSGSSMRFSSQMISKRFKSRRLLLAFAAVGVVAVLMFSVGRIYMNRSAAVDARVSAKNFKFTQLTSQGGEELFPNIAPDGKNLIYASRESGNWDIYLQRIGGANPTNLTKDSQADDKQGVYSPDGESIAFRSERGGGGIFVMGATGESVRRITKLGYHPAWSPDGNEIVYGIDDFEEPGSRTITPSELWRINIATGEKRLITKSDAVQPSWSPNGFRIAFWGVNSAGQRDIFTVAADGGQVIPVTNDAATDWNPDWSADGKLLYFLSDRDGSMNLWQVAIDEKSGQIRGQPEAVTIPSKYSKFLDFSRDGKSFAYVQTTNYSNIFQTSFDPRTEIASKIPVEVTRGSRITTNPDVSPDNRSIVFDAIGEKQEDLFVSAADGSGMRQLTNDVYKDRAPRWSPDGKRVAYFSDASGKYECWTIDADGSNRKRISNIPEGSWAQIPVWSPDGRRLLCNTSTSYPVIYDLDTLQSVQISPLPTEGDKDHRFMAYSWSPDGNKLAGYRLNLDGSAPIPQSYDFKTNRTEKLTDFGNRTAWLADSRRLLFTYRDRLFLLDTKTKRTRQLLSIAPYRFQALTISKDNRSIYYAMQKSESDIWLASSE